MTSIEVTAAPPATNAPQPQPSAAAVVTPQDKMQHSSSPSPSPGGVKGLSPSASLTKGKNRPRSASAAEGMTDVIEVVGVSSERRTSGASAGDGGGSTDNLVDITGRALKSRWRCPDPGCKKSNSGTAMSCCQCALPRHSMQQFKKGGNRGGRGGGGSGWKNRPNRGNNWSRNKPSHSKSGPAAIPEGVDPNNPMVALFREHASALDSKHDKHERIVKLSRDITAESKKVIFLLHRITCEDDKPTILGEAEVKMAEVKRRFWFLVATELNGEDHFKFLRAYTGGLQEYIEALSFYHYLCYGRLIQWKEVQDDLTFRRRIKRRKNPSGGNVTTSSSADSESTLAADDKNEKKDHNGDERAAAAGEESEEKKEEEGVDGAEVCKDSSSGLANADPDVKNTEPPKEASDSSKSSSATEIIDEEVVTSVCVPKTDFVLGLADLTGEVMRQAINCVGLGNISVCFDLLDFLHEIHGGFLALPRSDARELDGKVKVLKQSMRKVENACYSINVRGTEVPKHMLKDLFIHDEEQVHEE